MIESLKFSTDAQFPRRSGHLSGHTKSSDQSNKSHSMDCKGLMTVDGAYDSNHERYDLKEKLFGKVFS